MIILSLSIDKDDIIHMQQMASSREQQSMQPAMAVPVPSFHQRQDHYHG